MTQFVDKMWHVAQFHLASISRDAAALRKGEVHRYTREVNGEEGRVEGEVQQQEGTFEKQCGRGQQRLAGKSGSSTGEG